MIYSELLLNYNAVIGTTSDIKYQFIEKSPKIVIGVKKIIKLMESWIGNMVTKPFYDIQAMALFQMANYPSCMNLSLNQNSVLSQVLDKVKKTKARLKDLTKLILTQPLIWSENHDQVKQSEI